MQIEDQETGNSHSEFARPTPLFESIYDLLWNSILAGEVAPGARIRDIEWAKRLGVSRTPVREAMRRLQQEGILIPLSPGGYQVKTIGDEDLKNLYVCRGSLERAATIQAAGKCTTEELAALRDFVAECDRAIAKKDFRKAFALNTAFHDKIVALARNSYLTATYTVIKRHIIFARQGLLNSLGGEEMATSLYRQRLERKQAQHKAIVKAMAAGDPARAGSLMEEHLEDSSKHFNVRRDDE
jgi:DNA-binding GntR family transcriptional regulator